MHVRISQPGVGPTTYTNEGHEHRPPIHLDITLSWDSRDIDAVFPLSGQNSSAPGKPPKLSDLDVFKYLGEHVKSTLDACPALVELLTKVIDFFKRHPALSGPETIGPREHGAQQVPGPVPQGPAATNAAAPVVTNPEGLQPG
ncbi:MAG TPA: hypothetical protein VIG66_06265, partial [Noviherbaspirillum sp.]